MANTTSVPAHVADLPEVKKKGLPLPLPALPPKLLAGGVLVAAGLISVLVAWSQTTDIDNPAAQIPYLASGGLLGVGLMAVGAALLGGGGAAAAPAVQSEDLAARVEQMAENIDWLADTVEQIAIHLNRVAATSGADDTQSVRLRG